MHVTQWQSSCLALQYKERGKERRREGRRRQTEKEGGRGNKGEGRGKKKVSYAQVSAQAFKLLVFKMIGI